MAKCCEGARTMTTALRHLSTVLLR